MLRAMDGKPIDLTFHTQRLSHSFGILFPNAPPLGITRLETCLSALCDDASDIVGITVLVYIDVGNSFYRIRLTL